MKPLLPLLLCLATSVGAQSLPYSFFPDRVVEGEWTARALDRSLVSNATGSIKTWKPTLDVSALPRFHAPGSPLLEAVWNLSLEEVLKDKIAGGSLDGALSAGALWPGVWTRDASFAAHLSLAWLFPDEVKASLRAKVADGRMVQDTGTGGSWPVSTDRVVWALAARELERATGDRAWVEEAYPVLKRSAEADRAVAYDPAAGLYFGETSFLDWREQSYPAWFQPADIYQSPATGTNALHRALYSTLEEWAPLLSRSAAETQTWTTRGESLALAMNQSLWAGKAYSIYRYPLTAGGQLSNRTDSLGNSLAVLLGVAPADRAALVTSGLPEAYGPPVIFPQLAHTGPYHNKSVWPFVTAYYGWAAQRTGHPEAAAFAFNANLRAAALFLTNKENLVHDTGRPEGTSVNSDRQLWSAAGQLSGYLRTLFGLDLGEDTLTVSPVVPSWIKGPLTLTGLPWRGRIVHVQVVGTGSKVGQATVNGRPLEARGLIRAADFAAGSTITIAVTLSGDTLPALALADATAKGPWDATSLTLSETRTLTWKTRTGVVNAQILANGDVIGTTMGNTFALPPSTSPLTVYSVLTWNEAWPATVAEPVLDAPGRVTLTFADRDLGELPGDSRTFDFTVPKAGKWLLRFRYTNTAGPVSTDNKAAVRSLSIDGTPAGALVFPQRGYVSTNRGWSTYQVVVLKAGAHTATLTFTAENRNMDGTVNRAVVDTLEALPLP